MARIESLEPLELDYVYHINGQTSKGFYYFQKKKMNDLESALKQQKIEYRIERRRL